MASILVFISIINTLVKLIVLLKCLKESLKLLKLDNFGKFKIHINTCTDLISWQYSWKLFYLTKWDKLSVKILYSQLFRHISCWLVELNAAFLPRRSKEHNAAFCLSTTAKKLNNYSFGQDWNTIHLIRA